MTIAELNDARVTALAINPPACARCDDTGLRDYQTLCDCDAGNRAYYAARFFSMPMRPAWMATRDEFDGLAARRATAAARYAAIMTQDWRERTTDQISDDLYVAEQIDYQWRARG